MKTFVVCHCSEVAFSERLTCRRRSCSPPPLFFRWLLFPRKGYVNYFILPSFVFFICNVECISKIQDSRVKRALSNCLFAKLVYAYILLTVSCIVKKELLCDLRKMFWNIYPPSWKSYVAWRAKHAFIWKMQSFSVKNTSGENMKRVCESTVT
jgi:hypothetical protein